MHLVGYLKRKKKRKKEATSLFLRSALTLILHTFLSVMPKLKCVNRVNLPGIYCAICPVLQLCMQLDHNVAFAVIINTFSKSGKTVLFHLQFPIFCIGFMCAHYSLAPRSCQQSGAVQLEATAWHLQELGTCPTWERHLLIC